MNRTLVWQLAFRYLRGKRSGNAVPILSRISMVAIGVASCAMIVLFSVVNGFEVLVSDLYKAFYPEIKITAARGKFFELNNKQYKDIRSIKGISNATYSIEDNVLLNSNDEQKVATIKGIDTNFFKVNQVRPYIIEGRDTVSSYPVPTALVGLQIANDMALDVNNAFNTLRLYYPNSQSSNLSLSPESAFQMLELKPDGIFRVQDEFDSKYILAPLPLAQKLLQAQGKYSSVELKLAKNVDDDDIKAALQKALGPSFQVATRFEQNKTLYMVMRTEKWAVFAILLLVMLIASFNMVGALSLLVLEKQKDMGILRAMGAQKNTIRNIFLAEGVLWSFTGGMIGLALGALLCLLQQKFSMVKLQGSFIIEAYPVSVQFNDCLVIIATLTVVGLLAAWYPALKARNAQVELKTS
jgi:lipoprotein-releasing system permease protein